MSTWEGKVITVGVEPYELPAPVRVEQVPGLGGPCDLCMPDHHYLLKCPACGVAWDEPCCPDTYRCPHCAGGEVTVTREGHDKWARVWLGH